MSRSRTFLTAAALLVVACLTVAACGGDSAGDAGSDALASAEALADELAAAASQRAPDEAAPSDEPVPDDSTPDDSMTDGSMAGGSMPDGSMTDDQIGELICTSLAEIAADIAAGNADPVMIQGGFTIGTLAASDQALANSALISERADPVAEQQCPEDRATVLGAVQLDSLAALYSQPIG